MQITLCEDDGILHGGTPQIVVVVVKFDDGKMRRLPFPAKDSIATLYEKLNSIAPQVAALAPVRLDIGLVDYSPNNQGSRPSDAPSSQNKPQLAESPKPIKDMSTTIEKEDVVTCIRVDEGRDKEATCMLMLGQDYRVLKVHQSTVTLPGQNEVSKLVRGYDVIDDKAATPERIYVFPHEVVFKHKRVSQVIPLERKVEELLLCPHCSTPTAVVLEGSNFKGTCGSCLMDIEIARIIVNCKTFSCAKEGRQVSCIDYGGKYQGKCNTCSSVIEVPYV